MSPSPSDRPRILRQDIVDLLAPLDFMPPQGGARERASMIDLGVTLTVAREAKVILFSSEHALALKPALDRFAEDIVEYRLPFPSVMLQFTAPIPETALLPAAEQTEEMRALGIDEDRILALLLGQEEEEGTGKLVNSASAWFATTTVNRVSWREDERAHLRMLPGSRLDGEAARRNKECIRNLAIACIAYINCENIYLDKKSVPDKVNRKRMREGKRVMKDYYVCRLRGARGEAAEGGGDGAHGYRYDVRGHFRRLGDGRLTWVRAHQRGLVHELYKPKVYKVE